MAVEQPKPRPKGLGKQPKYTQGQGLGDIELRADLEKYMYGNPLARLGYELYKEGKINLVPKDPDGRGNISGSYMSPKLAQEKRNSPQGLIEYIQREEIVENKRVDPLKILIHELTHAGIDVTEARERNRLRNLADEYAIEGKTNEPSSRPGFNPYGYVNYEEGVTRAGDTLIQGRLGDGQNVKNEQVGKTGLDKYFKHGRSLKDNIKNRKIFKQRYLDTSQAAQDILNEKGIPPEVTSPSDTREESFGRSFKDFFRTLVGKDKERSKLNYLGFAQPIDDEGNVYDRDIYNRDGELSLGYIDPSDPSKLNKGAALMTMPLTEATSNPTGNKPRKEKKLPQRGAKPDNSRVDPRDEALKLVAKNMKQKTQKGIAAPTAPAPMMTAGQMPPAPAMNTGLAAPTMPMPPQETPMPIMAAKGKALEDGGKSKKKGKGLAVVIDMGSAEKPEYEEASMGTPSDPPPGATADEVKDNQQVLLSEGELVVPANVVRYHGLGMYEGLRREALQGLGEMEDAGQVEYIDDGIKTAQAGMTIMNAPNVATSQGIAKQQDLFGRVTTPEAASAKFVSTGFVDKNRDGVDDKMQRLSLPVPTSPASTTPAGLRLGPTTDATTVVGAGNVGSYKDEQKNPGDDDGTTPPKDDTPAPVAPTKVVQQDSGGDDGGDPEISAGLGGARTTIGGVEYAVQYDFSGNVIGLANVADALESGRATFQTPRKEVANLVEEQRKAQIDLVNPFVENNKAKANTLNSTLQNIKDPFSFEMNFVPEYISGISPSSKGTVNPNAIAAPEIKAESITPSAYDYSDDVLPDKPVEPTQYDMFGTVISPSIRDTSGKPVSLAGPLRDRVEEAQLDAEINARGRSMGITQDIPSEAQKARDEAFREEAEAKSRKEARDAQMRGIGLGLSAAASAPGTSTNDALQGKGYSSYDSQGNPSGAAPAGSQYSSTGTFSTGSAEENRRDRMEDRFRDTTPTSDDTTGDSSSQKEAPVVDERTEEDKAKKDTSRTYVDDTAGGGNSSSCFIKGTKVTLSNGKKRSIEKLKKGDLILGVNGNVNTVLGLEQIVADKDTIFVKPEGYTSYFMTNNHPFYYNGKLISYNAKRNNQYNPWLGNVLDAKKYIKHKEKFANKKQMVYNIYLDGDHTFYANGLPTHNIITNGFISFALLYSKYISNDDYLHDIEYTQGVKNRLVRLGYSKIAYPIAYEIMKQSVFGKICASICKPFVTMTSSIAQKKKSSSIIKTIGYSIIYPTLYIRGLFVR